MHSGRLRQLSAVLLGAAAVTGFSTTAAWSQAVVPPAANAAASAEKELEAATAKIREGKIDEAWGIIKEKAARHPEWPSPRLILARVLFNVNQAAAGRQALEQAAVEAPDDPDVYLNLGGIALGDGRISDARLNLEHVLSLIGSGHVNAQRAQTVRREASPAWPRWPKPAGIGR